MATSNFQQVCDLLGLKLVGPKGDDFGERLPLASQQALLRAWGIEISEDHALETVGAALAKNHWQRIINPVMVTDEETQPLVFVIRLSHDALKQSLHWIFTEESGSSWEGTVNPAELEILEEVELEDERFLSLRLIIDDLHPPTGYHQLTIQDGSTGKGLFGRCTLVITPLTCYSPPSLEPEARIWGVSCQLETIKSRRNWGVGDLSDLQAILSWAAENGAGTVMVAPLLFRRFPNDNQLYPSLPSSRCFLDPLYLDVEAVADFRESEQVRAQVNDPAFQVRLANLRDSDQIAHNEVAAVKRMVFEALWHHFQLNHLDPETDRGWSFRHFQTTGGRRLQAFAVYAALQDHFRESTETEGDVALWPEPFQNPASPELTDFVRTSQERIEYHQYLQWQLELQLAELGKRSMELGLKVGLTLSLPAGIDGAGFDAWHQPSLFGNELQVYDDGGGQDCYPAGPPVLKAKLAEMVYEPFIAMLRCNMRHAGALCFRSIGMLDRQLWHSAERTEAEPVYLAQGTADLLGIIALESRRNRCLVIGEHRAPLSNDFVETLRHRGILLSRPGYFEKDPGDDCLESSCPPSQTVIMMTSRYDLCSFSTFWQGRDIALLSAMCPDFDDEARENTVIARALTRAYLLVALNRENLLPPGYDMDPASVPVMAPDLIRAVLSFLVRTPARIFLVPLVDLPLKTGQDTTPDLPQGPAWRQRMTVEWESLTADELLPQLFREFCRERGIGVVRPSWPLADRRRRQRATSPRSFYRLQFNQGFTFRRAAALIPYLKELGISHCYASPYLKARPGSSHGYDIIDHSALNPEIGSREDYEEFVVALDRNSMAQILDMVPNHMGVGPDNTWWTDILENGQASLYADFFDINWQSREEQLQNRILLPVLGNYFGAVLEAGALRLVFQAERGSFCISYYDQCYPLAPETYPQIMGHDLQRLETRVGSDHEGFLELQSLTVSFANLPGREECGKEKRGIRARNKEVLKRLLARLCREIPEIASFLEENIIYLNGEPGRPRSFDPLEKLLAQQAFRLAFWRVASDEINYRRFFDINDLAGIRMERKDVFDTTHRFVLDLIATGKIDGLRIDHPDGLYDPGAYFCNLQAAVAGISMEQWKIPTEQQSARERQAALPLYVVVEKILADFEQLPAAWMVHGTSGYDFSCLVNDLFVDQSTEADMTAIYHQFIGRQVDFSLLAHDCKRLIIKTAMAGEINVLSSQLHHLARQNRYTQDYTLNGLRAALTEIVAFFPVYRTYCTAEAFTESDRHYVELAVDQARNRQQAEDTSIYDFIKSVLLLEPAPLGEEENPQRTSSIDFIMKFQQYTGPIMAKGLEDTAFYIYNRLLSLNEVGSDPRRFGVSVASFHAANQARSDNWPAAMLTTSTHDSKRSEDVRARINVLSEMPAEWRDALTRWQELNREKKIPAGAEVVPSKNDEYALYQNLLGVWPSEEMTAADREVFRERFTASMLKMIREAKVHTSWLNQNATYEAAMSHFIGKLLDGEDRAFLEDFIRFQKKVAWFGLLNSLSQLLLKLTSPGVPDIYQGNEIFHFCLVDPDNRQAVDFDQRMAMLDGLRRLAADDSVSPADHMLNLLQNPFDGRIKMYLLWKTLRYRQENSALFEQGSYEPIQAQGVGQEHVCAFGRRYQDRTLLVAVPRLVARLLHQEPTRLPLGSEVWQDTVLLLSGQHKDRVCTNVLTGEERTGLGTGTGIPLADLFSPLPFALLALR